MSVEDCLLALRGEIAACFPAGTVAAAAVAPGLRAVERALAKDDTDAAWQALDLLEDLLESRMREAGWPQAGEGAR
ncbi:hypothetical protein G6O69_15460 [Pseudenhygromyxa sp. WMMC2535]|uniref:hypothetical protein n=1 Tax=Pseudenhygromyxa sp. WMMC2535 TaxID=2712867 RepID=UPI0015550A41|nr:hypothetical protein [Pseudenhygromyxa sp. WMMC2535]NVB39240.1 hypothetical protein [Pseudenhygromyxa sp. WMMC2535]